MEAIIKKIFYEDDQKLFTWGNAIEQLCFAWESAEDVETQQKMIDEFEEHLSSQLEPLVMPKIAEETELKLLWLDNLLCTIHRDGGHFIEENGYQKAYDKAMEKIINWLPIT